MLMMKVADVLSLIVECSSAMIDTQTLCNLLQLNTACSKALQRSRGQQRITIKATQANATAFASWLPKHAGLISELLIERPSRTGMTTGWQKSPTSQEEQATGATLASAVLWCMHASATAASNASVQPSAAAATGAPIQLQLQKLRSSVYVPPSLLQGLPSNSLTRLELLCARSQEHSDWRSQISWGTSITPALWQLSNLQSLTMQMGDRYAYGGYEDEEDLSWGRYPCRALRQLTKLTRLDMGPLVTGDAKRFPTSLVELQLEVVAYLRLPEPPSPPALPRGNRSSRRTRMFPAASPDEDSLCDWYEDWKEGQQYGCQLSVKRQQRVLQLNLSHLPLLQRCELMRTLSYPERDERDVSLGAVQVQLAAPHLTKLRLGGEFEDLAGLQECCAELQELTMVGCRTSTSCLASLLSCMPELRSFEFDGYDHNWDDDGFTDEPMVKTMPEEERQLAAALGAATKLTKLSIEGVGPKGVYGGNWLYDVAAASSDADEGGRSASEDGDSSGTGSPRTEQCGPWGQSLPNLTNLQELQFVAEDKSRWHAADFLQLTALTALTKLQYNLREGDVAQSDSETLAQLKQLLPWVQDLDIGPCDKCWEW